MVILQCFWGTYSYAKVNNLQLDRLTVEDGLSQGTIYKVMQDNLGFLWIATEGGIDIYDGNQVKKLPLPKALNGQTVYHIMQDSKGLIWLNFATSGVYTFDPTNNKFTYILKADPLNAKHLINGFTESENGHYWLISYKTLLLHDQKTGVNTRLVDFSPVLKERESLKHIFYQDNFLYIASSAGIFVYSIVSNQWWKMPEISHNSAHVDSFNIPEATKSFTIYVSAEKVLYVGTNDGLFKIDVSNPNDFNSNNLNVQQKIKPKYHPVIANIETWGMLAKDNHLYVVGSQGLSAVDLSTAESEFYFGLRDDNDKITDNKIISLMIDQNDNFWLGSNATGLYRWNPKREVIDNYLYQRNGERSLSNNEVWTIHQQKNSELVWIGTTNGLNLLDKKNRKISSFLFNPEDNKQYSRHHIYEIFEDHQQRLWLSTGRGLGLFDMKTKKLIQLPFDEALNQLLSKDNVSIYLDDNDTLWYLSYNDLFKINIATGEYQSLTEITTKLNIESIFQVLGYFPDSNKLVISTNNALWSFDTETKKLDKMYGFQDTSLNSWSSADSWAVDKNNILWVAFTKKELVGLSLDTLQVKHIFNQDNAKNLNLDIYGIMADEEGDIWFSNHQGIHFLDADSQHIQNFDREDGLPTTEFNGGAFEKLASGEFIYGSMAGASIFNPLVLKKIKNKVLKQAHLAGVSTLSRELNFPLWWQSQNTLSLNYDDVGIRFDFSTFAFNTHNIRYEYTLTGNTTVKYPLTKESSITFPSLGSGEHSLIIRTLSPTTGKFSVPTTVFIKVSYAPWASPIAYTGYAIIVFLLVMFFIIKRERQQKILLEAHEKTKVREKRLQLALVGSNSDVWEWQAKDNLMFGKRIVQELGYLDLGSSYAFSQHLKYIHPDDKEQFLATWHNFIKNKDVEDNFSCIYRMKHHNGGWLWYKDLGKIVSSSHTGEPIRITGSYMNITQTRADEERAQYFGDAFRQTKDWVLIISENFSQVTANQSFREVFNWSEEENQFRPELLGIERDRWLYYRRLLPTLKEGEFWRGEELITTENKDEYHVLVNINVSRNESNKSIHYVCIFTDITAQKNAEKELRYLANYDHLTDLPNRALLLERIKHAMDYSKRMSSSIALFFIDLDRFKQVNDSLGHDIGDLLLIEVTRRLTSVLRVDDTIARIGGDEFVILLESFRGSAHLGKIAQKIISAIEQPVNLHGNVVSIGASIGISLYPDDALNSDELLRNADIAMYQAKQIGRNTFQFFTPRMNFEAELRLKKESSLKLAQQNNEFINHYQAVVDIETGEVIGAELLLRWQTSDGLLLPHEFIALAEELRVIIPITDGALERALGELVAWRVHRPDLFLSVNLANSHAIDEALIPRVKALLKQFDLPSSALRFEITESSLISDPDKAVNAMRAIVNEGISLVLDDFGLGYSSLSYLKKLPLEVIKIDRSFVAGIESEQADCAIIEAIVILAKSLNMQCIVVGVERSSQLEFLKDHECRYMQGFIFSQPITATLFEHYLLENTLKTDLVNA